MPYSTDISALETYINSSLNSSEPSTDTVVFLYRVLTELLEVVADVETIKSNTTTQLSNRPTSTNQMTIINRLTDIGTDLNTLIAQADAPLTELKTTLEAIITNLTTGKVGDELTDIRTFLDAAVSNLQSISDKAAFSNSNEDEMLVELRTIRADVAELEENDYSVVLKPDGGINSNIVAALESIHNQLEALQNANLITRDNIIITNQLLVDQPKIVHLVLNNANEEYNYVLPIGTRRFSIKLRHAPGDTNSTIRYAYVPGIVGSSTPTATDGYYNIGTYVEDEEYDINLTNPLPIYFSASIPNTIVVIKYWGTSPINVYAPASEISLKNLTLTTANTEYMLQFPQDTKRFTIKMLNPNANDFLKIAFVAGIVASGSSVDGNSYTIIYGDGELIEPDLGLNSTRYVYVAGSRAGIVVGYEYWT